MRVRLSYNLVLVIAFMIIVSFSVYAFGISYPYMEGDTLKLYPGQSYMFKLVVQNKDKEDMSVSIRIDSAIAKLVGPSEIDVPGESYDTAAFFNITVPDNAQVGDIFNINYVVSPIGRGEGQIPLAVAYSRGFKVLVTEKPVGLEEPTGQAINVPQGNPLPLGLIIPILVFVILIIVAIVWRKSHQVSERISKPRAEAGTASTANLRDRSALSQITVPVPRFTTASTTAQKRLEISIDSSDLIEPPEKPDESEGNSGLETSKPIRTMRAEPIRAEPAAETAELIPLRQPRKEKTISSHHYFHLKNGRSLKSLRELYSAFKDMPEDEFNHHVNSSKNDFANWIEHVFEDKELADSLRTKHTKQETMDLIKNELDQN